MAVMSFYECGSARFPDICDEPRELSGEEQKDQVEMYDQAAGKVSSALQEHDLQRFRWDSTRSQTDFRGRVSIARLSHAR